MDTTTTINPAFWIDVIRVNVHCSECPEKRLALTNAANHLERYIAALKQQPRHDGAEDARDGARYRRLRGYGCAPMGMGRDDLLNKGMVSVGTNLDALVDKSLKDRPLYDAAIASERSRT